MWKGEPSEMGTASTPRITGESAFPPLSLPLSGPWLHLEATVRTLEMQPKRGVGVGTVLEQTRRNPEAQCRVDSDSPANVEDMGISATSQLRLKTYWEFCVLCRSHADCTKHKCGRGRAESQICYYIIYRKLFSNYLLGEHMRKVTK